MLSRLIDINPDVELQPELKDYEFGRYNFEILPKARSKMVHKILTSLDGVDVCEINITYDNSENSPYSVKLPLSNEKFSCLQDKDLKVRQFKQKVIQGQYAQFYFIKKGVLYRSVVDNGHKFEVAVVPEDFIGSFAFRSQSVWTQWIPKNLCCNQACLLLERDEKTRTGSL